MLNDMQFDEHVFIRCYLFIM